MQLVAAINVHGVHRMLTFNTGDFTRYRIEVLHPASVLAEPDADPAPGQ